MPPAARRRLPRARGTGWTRAPWTARLAVPLLLASTACGSGGGAPDARPVPTGPSPLVAAPEPARAPVPATAPAGAVLALGGGHPEGLVADPVTGLVAVALRDPDRLGLLDPAGPRVAATVPVPGAARHLDLAPGGGAVLVPGEDTDTLATVALPEGRVTGTVRTGRQPHDVAVTTGGDVYVADEFGGSVSLVRGGQVVTTFPGLLQPGGAQGAGDVAAVVDVRARLLHLYRDGRETAALPAGAGPTHVLHAGGGVLWVADTSGDALLRYTTAGPGAPVQTGSVALPGRPYGLALDAARGLLYATATARNELVQYAVTPDGLREQRRWPTVRDAYDVAVVPATGRVVVAGESGSELQVLDP